VDSSDTTQQPDMISLLLQGDPVAAQKRQAALLRGQQDFSNAVSQANQNAHGLDLLNFVANSGSNNPLLGRATSALAQGYASQNAPTKLDHGMYVPSTGQYVSDPSYVDEQEASREQRRLLAASTFATQQNAQAERAQAAADRTLMMGQIAQGNQQVRAMMLQHTLDQQKQLEADRQQRMFQTSQGRVANLAKQTNLPALMASSTELVNRFQPYINAGTSNIPGLGQVDRMGNAVSTATGLPMDWLMSGKPGEGSTNRAMLQSALIDQLKTQVGMSPTEHSRAAQAIETLNKPGATGQDIVNAYNNALWPRLEANRKAVLGLTASWTPEQWDQHIASGGNDYRVPIPKFEYSGKGLGLKPKASVPGVPGTTGETQTPTLDPAVAKKYGL
jgi:hypothetical protein